MLRTYQILELGLSLVSGDEGFLRAFDEDYLRFAAPAPLLGRQLDVRFQGGPAPFLEVDGQRRSLAGHPDPAQHARFALHGLLMDALEGFTVLHAAVLETGSGALAICGSPGTGKTTLTLDLLEAGLGFLSDDFCPVHRATGLVHPYPRSLWVRDPRADASTSGGMLHRGKVQASPEQLRVPTGPRPLIGFLFLDPGPEAPGPVTLEVRIRPEGRAAFLRDAAGVEGVLIHPAEGRGDHELRLEHPRDGATVRKLMAVLDQHREALWTCFGLPTSNPDFTQVPALVPMASHEAAFQLLKERKQRKVSLEGKPLEPGAFLAHLNGLLAGVPCGRLTAGPRDQRLRLVQQFLTTRNV